MMPRSRRTGKGPRAQRIDAPHVVPPCGRVRAVTAACRSRSSRDRSAPGSAVALIASVSDCSAMPPLEGVGVVGARERVEVDRDHDRNPQVATCRGGGLDAGRERPAVVGPVPLPLLLESILQGVDHLRLSVPARGMARRAGWRTRRG